jgi:ribulose-phosphate 3-epimerase
MRTVKIAPSILSADFGRLAEEIRSIEASGCDIVHVDVMDGHFVPNLTIGPVVIRWIRKVTSLPLDVHLMIEDPIKSLADYRKAGADWITVHVEAAPDVRLALETIRQSGAKAGLSLRPGTSIEMILPFLDILDLVLIMTVEPGFGGQSFMPDMMEKVRVLRSRFQGMISVDGGVNTETAVTCRTAGADILVAGTAVFGQPDRRQAIQMLRGAVL